MYVYVVLITLYGFDFVLLYVTDVVVSKAANKLRSAGQRRFVFIDSGLNARPNE